MMRTESPNPFLSIVYNDPLSRMIFVHANCHINSNYKARSSILWNAAEFLAEFTGAEGHLHL